MVVRMRAKSIVVKENRAMAIALGSDKTFRVIF